MSTELVIASAASVPATGGGEKLPVLVERAGGAAHFAWDEFFYAEHHNKHTQRAYRSAVRRFLAWCEGEGIEEDGKDKPLFRSAVVRTKKLTGKALTTERISI